MKWLKLSEWEEVQDYTITIVQKLNWVHGLNVISKIYRTHDNKMGITLQLFDKHDNYFCEYKSGIHDTVKSYISAIDNCYLRIKNR